MKRIQIGDVVGDYKVIDLAGSGGMGAVYKIEHVITRRIEAMKLLPPGLSGDPEQARRFEREIQLQARLHHPNIVALYNAVRDGDSFVLVMEFVEGESLQRMLESGPLPVETAVDFTCQVLRALACAHDAGVIHRDVSPANIIITPGRVAMLTDFGLALGAGDPRLSSSGVPLGSPWYMSPEQVRASHTVDARTDLYAVGAVLHEMLTGRKLFEAEGAFEVLRAQVELEPPPPSSRNPKVPAALDGIVKRAVAKDPAMRFRSADEFRLALENLAVGAAPPLVPSRLRTTGRAILVMAALAALAAAFYPHAAAEPEHPPALPVEVGQASSPVLPEEPPQPPVPAEEPAAVPPPPVRSRAKAIRRPRKPPRSNAIRVTVAESLPPAAIPTPRPDPPPPVEVPEPVVPKADFLEAPGPAAPGPEAPPAAALAPEPPAASPEAAPAKPPNTGNRFVRALGKVNPFRRWMKRDTSKTPPQK